MSLFRLLPLLISIRTIIVINWLRLNLSSLRSILHLLLVQLLLILLLKLVLTLRRSHVILIRLLTNAPIWRHHICWIHFLSHYVCAIWIHSIRILLMSYHLLLLLLLLLLLHRILWGMFYLCCSSYWCTHIVSTLWRCIIII